MRLGLSIHLLVAVAACSSSASHADRGPGVRAGPMVQARSVDDLFGPTPSIPAILGRLGLGSRTRDIATLAPELRAAPPWPTYANILATGYATEAIPGATFHFLTRPTDDTIDAIILVVDKDASRGFAAIQARWGRPLHVWSREAHYQDLAAGVRAIVEGEPGDALVVNYVPVVRIEQLLGRERGRLGFERRSLIGAALADVPALLAKLPGLRLDAPTSIVFPRLDESAFSAGVSLDVKDGKVIGYRLQLPFEWHPDRKRALADALATNFGPATHTTSGVTYPGPPGVEVNLGQEGQLLIYVGQRE